MARCIRGFTLIELLMVTAILAIVSLVSVPYLIHSMRGNRLRTAARAVVQSSKYARSMALLRQQTVSLDFALNPPVLSVRIGGATGSVPAPAAAATNSASSSPKVNAEEPTDQESAVPRDTNMPPPGEHSQGYEIKRVLDGVRIESIEIGENKSQTEGSATVLYHANGLCDPFQVRLVDDQGSAVVITVDPLSTATTENRD